MNAMNFEAVGERRKELVQAVATVTGEKAIYQRMPTCAYEIGPFTVSKEGTLAWAEGTDADLVSRVLAELAEQGFTAADAVEAETEEPEAQAEAPTATDAVEAETEEPEAQADNPSAPTTDTLTIEYPAKMADDRTLANLDRILESKGNLIRKAIGTDSLSYEVTEETVKFPWFTLTGDENEVSAYTHLIAKLMGMARDSKRIVMKEKPVDNEKYAFRCFLLRLGFIGEEYKAERKILMKNLSGNSAWKTGKPE